MVRKTRRVTSVDSDGFSPVPARHTSALVEQYGTFLRQSFKQHLFFTAVRLELNLELLKPDFSEWRDLGK